MENKRRIILQRVDGAFVNLKLEPVNNPSAAARFNDISAYESFIYGFYGPSDPSMYKPVYLSITYEVIGDVQ
ncbi:hypothetical protein [Cohnella zeiphila]|uniref:Uncharacterized protein n=1 Tax=Cohnella zeiphila TaxID=2761120 RepID=A0A7X0VW02_9BACL|nr:hypothetical protein [Cohnella zeiphila]MBB6731917.1 hypothetical protein [Cohnella zeiphila]